MYSATEDIGEIPGHKSNNDVLNGCLTVVDFANELKQSFPNFSRHVQSSRTTIGSAVETLHEFLHMPGKKPTELFEAKIEDKNLERYLHSLMLALKANKQRVEDSFELID